MSRNSPLRFVLSLVLEVALVVLIVSILPRIDLSGGRDAPPARGTADASTLAAGTRTPNPIEAILPLAVRDPEPADVPPRLTPITALPASAKTPPRWIALDSEQPELVPPPLDAEPVAAETQYAEQRLDRASQSLLNGLGSYVARAAGELFQAPTAAETQPATTTQAAAEMQPQPPYIARSPAVPAPAPAVTLPPPAAAPPSFSTAAPASVSSSPPQIVLPQPATGGASPVWNGSFPAQPTPPAAAPVRPAPATQNRVKQWRNY